MSLFDRLSEFANEILHIANDARKKHFYNYNVLETAIDDFTFAASDGSLLTVVRIDGLKTITSANTYIDSIVNSLTSALAANFKQEGHILQLCYQYDPSKAEEIIDRILEDSHKTCDRLGLDWHYLLDERKRVLLESRTAAEESNFMLLWTTPKLFSKQELANETKAKIDEFKNSRMPSGGTGSPFISYKGLINKHASFVQNTLRELGKSKIEYMLMDVRATGREIRGQSEPERVADNWKLFLPGDKVLPYQVREYNDSEGFNVVAPAVREQVVREDAVPQSGNKIIKVGNKYYAPMYFAKMPQELGLFFQVFPKLISYHEMPWRMLFTIGGDGLEMVKVRRALTSFLAWASQNNSLFNRAVDSMRSYVNEEGGTAVRFQINACTWGNTQEEADRNASQLLRTLEGWGSPEVSDTTGNPISGFASASLGFTAKPIGNPSAAPLVHAVQMLPLSRPTAIWEKGSQIFSTVDGKLMPYQPMSQLQNSWISLIFAIPGYGKSVLMNSSHVAFMLNPLNEDIPYISIADIGFSSSGFIKIVQDGLAPERRHLALHLRLSNTKEYCINPGDTHPGCRFPLDMQKMYQIGLLSTAMTDPMTGQLPSGITNFLSELIDKTYERLSDCYISFPNASPKKYVRHKIAEVDNALKAIGFKPITQEDISERVSMGENVTNLNPTSWWEITDALFQHPSGKYEREGILAQRYAVPTWKDFIDTANNDTHIQATYGEQTLDNGELLIKVFIRMMGNALGTYHVLSDVTQYDIQSARIIALDLEEVANGNSPVERKQAAIMYMFAINLLAANFALKTENASMVPAREGVQFNSYTNVEFYKTHFIKKIGKIQGAYKRLALDELHRTNGIESMRQFLVQIGREYRKRKTELMCASQMFDDFPEELVELQTALWVLSPCSEEVVQKMRDKAGVTEPGEIDTLKRGIVPAAENGGAIVGIFKTKGKDGRYAQQLHNKMGAIELWSFTTTQDDFRMFQKMEEVVGNSTIAREILAKAFPGGSADKEIERLQRAMDSRNPYDVYERIAKEKAELYLKTIV